MYKTSVYTLIKLTATCNDWHTENSKNHKSWYHLPSHRL